MRGMELKLARIGLRIKQIDVSRETGIAPSRLSLIENEYATARPEELTAIRAALKLDESPSEECAASPV